MTMEIDVCRPNGQDTLIAGRATYLTSELPGGLFRCDRGDTYVLGCNEDAKVAVTLAHTQLPPGVSFALGAQRIGHGRWLGRYKLRLTHAIREPSYPGKSGSIRLAGDRVILDCGAWGKVTLGSSPVGSEHHGDYDGWNIEALETPRPFVMRTKLLEGVAMEEAVELAVGLGFTE